MGSISTSDLLSKYGISPALGFLSPDHPCTSFTSPHYAQWDKLAAQLPGLLKSRQLAAEIAKLPNFGLGYLESEPEWRRAYVVLGFLIHGHVWAGSATAPIEVVPPQLAEPFLEVCTHLGVEPVLSYSGLVLWNWTTVRDEPREGQLPELEGLVSLASFTGTRSEDAFYHVPVLTEAEGGHLIPLLLETIQSAQSGNFGFVRSALETSAATFSKMGAHLPKLFSTLEANMFYHELRPFLAGGKGMEGKGLPRGMVFERCDGTQVEVKCIGGSAAQSSLFPFLDHVLGVEHEEAKLKESVFREMRSYMPRQHRDFLDFVGTLPSLRSFIEDQGDSHLRSAFDECLAQLKLWRGKHISVVSKYIVQPARAAARAEAQAQDSVEAFESVAGEDLQGTGGSSLIPFLRQSKDETVGLQGK